MDLSSIIGVAIGLALGIAFALIVWRVVSRRSQLPDQVPDSLQQVAQARLDPDERPASLISEQIEEMVRAELSHHPDLAEASLDFGTAEDGSLEVWFRGERFSDPDQVPDERVRAAIARAVETFNR